MVQYSCQGQGIFLFCNLSRPVLETMQFHILWIIRCICIGVKVASVCEILHSPPYSVDVESEFIYISAQHVCLNDMGKGDAVIYLFKCACN